MEGQLKLIVTKKSMSIKLEFQSKLNVTQNGMSLKLNIINNGMSLKISCHRKWNVTQNRRSL